MSTQSEESYRGFFQSTGGQLTVLSIAIVAILAIAWFYVW